MSEASIPNTLNDVQTEMALTLKCVLVSVQDAETKAYLIAKATNWAIPDSRPEADHLRRQFLALVTGD